MYGVAGFQVRLGRGDGVLFALWVLRGLGTMEAQKLGRRMVGTERCRVCVWGWVRRGVLGAGMRVQWVFGREYGRRRDGRVRGKCRSGFVASIVLVVWCEYCSRCVCERVILVVWERRLG